MKNKYIQIIENSQQKNNTKINTGDTVIVKIWVVEGKKKRIQSFKGIIIKIKNRNINSSFIVRKISSGIGVERTFQKHSPIINEIIIEKKAKIKKSKIYYIRNKVGKSARIKEKIIK